MGELGHWEHHDLSRVTIACVLSLQVTAQWDCHSLAARLLSMLWTTMGPCFHRETFAHWGSDTKKKSQAENGPNQQKGIHYCSVRRAIWGSSRPDIPWSSHIPHTKHCSMNLSKPWHSGRQLCTWGSMKRLQLKFDSTLSPWTQTQHHLAHICSVSMTENTTPGRINLSQYLNLVDSYQVP